MRRSLLAEPVQVVGINMQVSLVISWHEPAVLRQPVQPGLAERRPDWRLRAEDDAQGRGALVRVSLIVLLRCLCRLLLCRLARHLSRSAQRGPPQFHSSVHSVLRQ
jgi:hypothetical protein